ncbi:hypothetical protein KFE25_010814 [Diacronema lutheri]|uniref:SSD domain-containing protein n=2 Tax=Diacronema lutheri TaxID=2081491 RepID=A0A8J5XH48_DIALT|nr:hypothetical protein KFE25_010814 [Diacronema lutheri]
MQQRLQHALASSFARWGRLVARHPLRVLFISLAVYLALCVGLLRLTPENRGAYLWVPTDSKSYQDWRYVEDNFGVEGHNMLLYARAKSGNIFDLESVSELLKAHEYTMNLQTEVRGKVVRFKDACRRLAEYDDDDYEGEECYAPSFLSLWNYELNSLIGSKVPILDKLSALHVATDIETFAANVVFEERKDGSKRVLSAEAVVLVFPLRSTDGASYDIQPAWNAGIAGAVDSEVVEVFHLSTRSFDDEVGRVVTGDIPLFAVGMGIITLFIALTLGAPTSLHRSRVLLGVMAIVNVLLAVGGGFGIASAIGVRFASIAALLPLILLGVQVDSVIILVDNLDAQSDAEPLDERIGKSLSKSGPAILVTALTTISAFATSTTTTMPAIAMFASFAALSFTVALPVVFTFFLALLVLDERRLKAGRISFAPCVRAHDARADEPAPADAVPGGALPATKRARSNKASDLRNIGRIQRFIRDVYAPTLLSPPVSALVVLAFVALVVLSALSVPFIKVGLPTEDVLPDDSYVIPALGIEKAAFGSARASAQIVLRGENYDNERTRDAYRRTRRGVLDLDFVKAAPPDWLNQYERWRESEGIELADGPFLARLHDFLGEIGSTIFQDDLVCDRDNSCKHPSDSRFNALLFTGTGDQIEQIGFRTRLEAVLQREGFDTGFAFAGSFLNAESDVAIWTLTWTNMVYALAVIFGIMLLFNPLPIAVWITVCVAFIDLDLLGVLWAVDLKLNAVSYVNLVMAVGLSVDYSVHLAHAFHESHAGALADAAPGEVVSTRDSAVYALTTMGASVIKGGFTTVLGVLVVAFASSVAFRTFFTLISFTVLLGLLHGMVLLPILLTYCSVRGSAPRIDGVVKVSV